MVYVPLFESEKEKIMRLEKQIMALKLKLKRYERAIQKCVEIYNEDMDK